MQSGNVSLEIVQWEFLVKQIEYLIWLSQVKREDYANAGDDKGLEEETYYIKRLVDLKLGILKQVELYYYARKTMLGVERSGDNV